MASCTVRSDPDPRGRDATVWGQPERRLKLKVFDASDGVQAGQGHFTTSARSPEGRLWFATRGVLQMVDPAHIAGNTVAPPVHINAIIADGKGYSPQERLTLPPLTRDLEIDYTALSFAVPQKVLFRYVLEGHDATWQEPGTRRQAFYNDLSPGPYRFRVIACNNDGVWNEVGATLNFSVAPAWYQTKSFRFLSVLSGLFVAWSLYRLRLRQMAMSMSALTMMTSDSGTEIKLIVPGGMIFQTSHSFREGAAGEDENAAWPPSAARFSLNLHQPEENPFCAKLINPNSLKSSGLVQNRRLR